MADTHHNTDASVVGVLASSTTDACLDALNDKLYRLIWAAMRSQ